MTRARMIFSPMSKAILAASFAVFIARAIEYLMIGSSFPALFITGVLAVVSMAYLLGNGWLKWTLKLWGLILLLYGLSRLALGTLIKMGTVDSAHAIDAASWIFMLLSVAYLGLGIYILRTRYIAPKTTAPS